MYKCELTLLIGADPKVIEFQAESIAKARDRAVEILAENVRRYQYIGVSSRRLIMHLPLDA